MGDLVKLLVFLRESADKIRHSRSAVVGIVVTGIAGGAASTGLVVLINSAFADPRPALGLLLAFAGLCLFIPVARLLSDLLLNFFAEEGLFRLRVDLGRKILASPLLRLERIGPHRLLATLTGDLATITGALVEVPLLCKHMATVVGCLAFMAWLSWPLLCVVLGFLAVGVVTYRIPVVKSLEYFTESREHSDRLYEHFRGLTEGLKDLLMHRGRRRSFVSELLEPSAATVRSLNIRGAAVYAFGNSWGKLLFFLAIGLTVFVIPRFQPLELQVLTGFTLAILYMLTPLDVLLNVFPRLSRATVAVEKIRRLDLLLDEEPTSVTEQRGEPRDWDKLELTGVCHRYGEEEHDTPFLLGPVDFSVEPGEVVFLTGGNGSGKTTLAKVLLGLYPATDGEIRLNGEAVLDTSDGYRDLFSVVFADTFLFERLLGIEGEALDARARDYLRELDLDHKVDVSEGNLSTVDLSQGQRKRLTLLTALLDDRPIYLFDEWAAEQDPEYRHYFYHQILPELRARGKGVVVISHDDRYFYVADRLVKLEYGKVVFSGDPASLPNLQSGTENSLSGGGGMQAGSASTSSEDVAGL